MYGATSSLTPLRTAKSRGIAQQVIATRWNRIKILIAPRDRLRDSKSPAFGRLLEALFFCWFFFVTFLALSGLAQVF